MPLKTAMIMSGFYKTGFRERRIKWEAFFLERNKI